MDARTYQTRIEALAQRWEAARTPGEMREMLHELASVFQECHDTYKAVIDDYKQMVDDLTATCTRQTATVTRLTAAVEQLTVERNQLLAAGVDAYERGYREFMDYTQDFLAEHYDAWGAYLDAHAGLVVAPEALSAIDPRPPDTALRLCHACHRSLGERAV